MTNAEMTFYSVVPRALQTIANQNARIADTVARVEQHNCRIADSLERIANAVEASATKPEAK